MRYWVSWRQWQEWTEDDDLADENELMLAMRDLTDSPKVIQFTRLLNKFLALKQLQEVNANIQNPRREQRIFSEALRELSIVLNNLLPRGNHER